MANIKLRYMLYHDIESKFGVGLNGDLVSRIAERV